MKEKHSDIRGDLDGGGRREDLGWGRGRGFGWLATPYLREQNLEKIVIMEEIKGNTLDR